MKLLQDADTAFFMGDFNFDSSPDSHFKDEQENLEKYTGRKFIEYSHQKTTWMLGFRLTRILHILQRSELHTQIPNINLHDLIEFL